MKNIIKTLLVTALFSMSASAFAASSDDLTVRELSKKASAAIKVISDESLFNLRYVGSATQAAVGITNAQFATQAPIGTADLTIDISAAAYDTLGELCDYLDKDADYVCALTGGKRDDASNLTKNVTLAAATDSKAVGGYNVLIDTGGTDATDPYIMTLGIQPESGKRVVLKYCIGNINVIDKLAVYGQLAKYEGSTDGVMRNDTTKVYSVITADDTDKTIGNVYGVPWMEFAKDAHVVVRSLDADNTQAAANYIECSWEEK